MKIALKITPQRSTQYTRMTAELAIPELLASPLAPLLGQVQMNKLAGQDYLLVEGDKQLLEPEQRKILHRLGTISEVFEYFKHIGSVEGPLLRPLDPPDEVPIVPLEMAEVRRYKGKTNELFTRVLLNVAIFGGDYAAQCTERLRILDPLAGGGTTLFLALAAGYDAFGIEQDRQDVESTAVFVRQYLESARVHHKVVDEHGRKAGRRFQFEVGPKKNIRHLVIAHGDARDAGVHMREVAGGPHMHAIVADLPYGIQHFGDLATLLEKALPSWENMLYPGGTIALAWNATRVERTTLVELLERHSALRVRNDPPFTQFAHTVDRVIKKRDLIVAVKQS